MLKNLDGVDVLFSSGMVRALEDFPNDATFVKCSESELLVIWAFFPFEKAGHLEAMWICRRLFEFIQGIEGTTGSLVFGCLHQSPFDVFAEVGA